MLPIDFEGSQVIGKPKNMTDEECFGLHAFVGIDENGYKYFLECWKPSKEDIDAIAAGRPIWIKILSNGLPPIAVWTLDENNEIN